MSGLGPGETLRITQTRQARSSPRKFYKFWEGGGIRYTIPNNDMMSVVHAIVERVFYVKINGVFQRPPKFTANPERLRPFRERLVQYLGKLSPCTPDQFCSSYGGSKLRMYENAAKSLAKKPLEWRDSWIRCFTKAEYLKPKGVPRLIQPRSPRYNVCLGCYLSPNEKTILHAIDYLYSRDLYPPGCDIPTIAKGHNYVDRGRIIAEKWSKFADPVCIGVDAARFDQHINASLLKFEHSIYRALFTGSQFHVGGVSLKTLLKWQRSNKGKWKGMEGKVKYTTKGCRMSGDMNTSLGNITIMTALWYLFIVEIREKLKNNIHVQIYNDGDDTVILVERKYSQYIIDSLADWFHEFGITMEFDGIYNTLEEITFCQAKPVFDGETWYLCPNPHKRCFSDLTTTKNIGSQDIFHRLFNMQVGAIAACGLAANGHTPILNHMYRKMGMGVELFIPEKNHFLCKFRQELLDNMKPEFREPTLEHRISFYKAFNISPLEQKILEDFYDNLPQLSPKISQVPPVRFVPALTLLTPILKPSSPLDGDGIIAELGRPIGSLMPPIDRITVQ